jgi:hypothetical protein
VLTALSGLGLWRPKACVKGTNEIQIYFQNVISILFFLLLLSLAMFYYDLLLKLYKTIYFGQLDMTYLINSIVNNVNFLFPT